MKRFLDWLKRVKGRLFGYSLGRVHDVIQVREGGEILKLRVDDDAMRLTEKVLKIQKELQALKDDAAEETKREAIRHFAEALFGEDQAALLFNLYNGNADCVLSICSMCFPRIAEKINKKQKKL